MTRQKPNTFCMHLPPAHGAREGRSPLLGLAAGPAASMQPGGLPGCSPLPPQAAASSAIPQLPAFPCPEVSKALPKTLGFTSSSLVSFCGAQETLLVPLEEHSPYLQPKEGKLDTQYCICHSVPAYPFYFKTIIFNVVEGKKDLLYIGFI